MNIKRKQHWIINHMRNLILIPALSILFSNALQARPPFLNENETSDDCHHFFRKFAENNKELDMSSLLEAAKKVDISSQLEDAQKVKEGPVYSNFRNPIKTLQLPNGNNDHSSTEIKGFLIGHTWATTYHSIFIYDTTSGKYIPELVPRNSLQT